MSASLAAARKRRGVTIQEPPSVMQTPSPTQPQAGLTLPQVIALVDKRLITLETFTFLTTVTKITTVTTASIRFNNFDNSDKFENFDNLEQQL